VRTSTFLGGGATSDRRRNDEAAFDMACADMGKAESETGGDVAIL
jgi:hypothetical protein